MVADSDRALPGRSGRLDMARLSFAGLVMLAHSSEYIDGNRHREPLTLLFHTLSFGEVGVAGFFVLSGYFITRSWERSDDAGVFVRKRAARIYPGFIVASIVATFVVGRIAAERPQTYYGDIDLMGFALRLLTLKPPSGPSVFAGAPYPFLDGALWTIQYELFCYMLVAMLGIVGIMRHPRLLVMIWLALLAALLAQHVIVGGINGPAVLYGPLPDLIRLLMLFFTGTMFAVFRVLRHGNRSTAIAASLILVIGLTVPLLAEPVLAMAGGYLLLRFGHSPQARSYRFPDLSYGTYLYGAPIEMLLIHLVPGIAPLAVFACAAPMAMLLGYMSWRWIERPALSRWSIRRPGSSLSYC